MQDVADPGQLGQKLSLAAMQVGDEHICLDRDTAQRLAYCIPVPACACAGGGKMDGRLERAADSDPVPMLVPVDVPVPACDPDPAPPNVVVLWRIVRDDTSWQAKVTIKVLATCNRAITRAARSAEHLGFSSASERTGVQSLHRTAALFGVANHTNATGGRIRTPRRSSAAAGVRLYFPCKP